MDVTSIRNQFIILLDVLRRLERETVKLLFGVSITGWIVLATALIGTVVCILLYSRDKNRAAIQGIPVTVCAVIWILFVSRLLGVFQSAGITDVGLFVVIWLPRRSAALFNSRGKRIGGAYIRNGQADISRAKRKAGTIAVVIEKEYTRRHIGEMIRFIAEGREAGSVMIPPGTEEVRAIM